MSESEWTRAFAPATVSNLGPGFDCIGLALRFRGDQVLARAVDRPGVQLLAVRGDGGRLPLDTNKNTAAVAVQALLDKYAPKQGVELELEKGLPLGSGLGSSGASACAALKAVNHALNLGLGVEALIEAAREGEAVACGAAHPDNVAPALAGGIVLVTNNDPLRILSLPVPRNLWLTVYTPGCEVETATARSVLPKNVSLGASVRQASHLATLVHALHLGDLQLLGEAIVDEIVEPVRATLIPGFAQSKAACMEAGAIACSISGAGPTTFALSSDETRAHALLEILDETYHLANVGGKGFVDQIGEGAMIVPSSGFNPEQLASHSRIV